MLITANSLAYERKCDWHHFASMLEFLTLAGVQGKAIQGNTTQISQHQTIVDGTVIKPYICADSAFALSPF